MYHLPELQGRQRAPVQQGKNEGQMNKYCLLTNDVETTSIWFNALRDETGFKVLNEGMPILLSLYEKHGIKTTFFLPVISQSFIRKS